MLLYIICSTFDMAILYIYLRQLLGQKKENISPILSASAYIISEILQLLEMHIISAVDSSLDMYIYIGTSLIITFLLTLLHDCKMRHRIFAALSFQVYATVSEIVVYTIFSILPEDMQTALFSEVTYGGICSKIVLFIILNITMLIFEKRKEFRSVKYSLLVLMMPVLSILLMLTIPIKTSGSSLEHTLTLIGLTAILVANVINYILLQNIIYLNEANQTRHNMDKQIGYQIEKYRQLSTAYRDTRRLIHDTKKHYFMIRELISGKEYDKATAYINDSITDLENVYSNINTGNLVIDSFVSNYALIAKQENIQLRTNLQVNPNFITIKDYDLSIIIGNLLDNAINSCRGIPVPHPRQITLDITTSSKELLIHIYNSVDTEHQHTQDNADNKALYHGFGTQNIEKITLAYNGTYSTKIANGDYHAIVSIPFLNV